MRGEPEDATSDSPARAGRLAPEGITRPQALLLIAALLGTVAILIAVGRLGLLDLHDVVRYSQADLDLDNVVQEVVGWLGIALAVFGLLRHGWTSYQDYPIRLSTWHRLMVRPTQKSQGFHSDLPGFCRRSKQ